MQRVDTGRPRPSFCSQLCLLFTTSNSVDLDDGRRLGLKEMLAEGGFSYVYRGEIDGHDVAVKKIVTMDQEQVLDVHAEMDAHREHQHLRLMPLIATGERYRGGCREFFLVFPLCSSSLRQEINASTLSGAPWSAKRLLKTFREVLEGVQYLHSRSPPVAHRDIKPENVLFKGGSVLLMDFGSLGVAQRSAETRRLAMAIQEEAAEQCTMPYRAPELWDVQTGSKVDEKVDIWALGALLYAMCFGYSPFECDYGVGSTEPRIVETSYLKVLANVVYPEIGIDERVIGIIKSCLRHDSATRPSADELIETVEGVLAVL